jgi:PhnB protein
VGARIGSVAFFQDATAAASYVAYVADVDAVFVRAVERGATVREKPDTFVTGDRFAST